MKLKSEGFLFAAALAASSAWALESVTPAVPGRAWTYSWWLPLYRQIIGR